MNIGALLTNVADVMDSTSQNSNRAAFGQNNIARREKQKDARVQTAQNVQLKILDAHLKALSSGDLDQTQAGPLIENTMKLAQGLGVDVGDPVSLFVPKQAEDVKVGGTIARKGADGTYTEVYTPPNTKAQRPITVSPGTQVLSPDGKEVVYENKNPRFAATRQKAQTAVGYNQQVLNTKTKAVDEARKVAESGDLSAQINYGLRRIEQKQAEGIYGVGEGKELRRSISYFANALKSYDEQYKKAYTLLDKNADAATIGGDVASAIRTAGANALGLLGVISGSENLSIEMDEWADQLTEVAGSNTELKSIIFSLAIQNAVAKGLDRNGISNKELEESIKDIGGRTRSPQAIKRRMKEIRSQLASSLRNNIDTVIENYQGVQMEDPIQPEVPPDDTSLTPAQRQRLQYLRDRR